MYSASHSKVITNVLFHIYITFFFSGNGIQGYNRLYQEGIYVPTEVSHYACFCKILDVLCCFNFNYIL